MAQLARGLGVLLDACNFLTAASSLPGLPCCPFSLSGPRGLVFGRSGNLIPGLSRPRTPRVLTGGPSRRCGHVVPLFLRNSSWSVATRPQDGLSRQRVCLTLPFLKSWEKALTCFIISFRIVLHSHSSYIAQRCQKKSVREARPPPAPKAAAGLRICPGAARADTRTLSEVPRPPRSRPHGCLRFVGRVLSLAILPRVCHLLLFLRGHNPKSCSGGNVLPRPFHGVGRGRRPAQPRCCSAFPDTCSGRVTASLHFSPALGLCALEPICVSVP